MNVRVLFAALFLGLAFSPVFAQTFRPLAGYEHLRERTLSKAPQPIDKMECGDFNLSGFRLYAPGESRAIRLGINTSGIDGTVSYQCDGCAEATSGVASVANDSLFYGADAGAELGLDTLRIAACNAVGVCTDTLTLIVLVRRADQDIDLGVRNVDPRGTVEAPVPPGGLPGGTFCRTIEACAPDYPGRRQNFAFLDNDDLSNNDFRYNAAGFAGDDAVCVTICNEFGTCDTYRTTLRISVPSVSLPFFDDFSYESSRPNPALWQDDDVLVNRNFAIEPPSIGVATFDAVDFSGQPYPAGSGGANTSIRDYLTSAPINLQGQNDARLSFYLQPRGLGNRPETQDSFLVQFRDQAGRWATVFKQAGLLTTEPNNSLRPFMENDLPIPAEYRYNGFQFRFASKSSEQGAVDMWHVDYVIVDTRSNRPADLALRELPPFILDNYTSMPLRHLRAGGPTLLREQLPISFQNLGEGANDVITVNAEGSKLGIESFVPGTVATGGEIGLLSANGFGTGLENENRFGPGEQVDRTTSLAGTGLSSLLEFYLFQSADLALNHKVALYYSFAADNETTNYLPVIAENNSLTRYTCLEEYMAYDDGTAEVTIEGNQGTTILQRFDAFVADSLRGVRVRIPRGLRPLGNQSLRLVVYTGESTPETLVESYDFPIIYAETFHFDSLQGYTTYLLPEALALEVGAYYVGWEQQRSDANIGIGFDRNSQPEGVQFFNNGNGWMPITGTTTGAIMLRPLLAGFDGFTTSTPAAAAAAEGLVDVFPNPTNGLLHLRPRPNAGNTPMSYRLYSMTGALLTRDRFHDEIDLSHLPAGVYVLEVTNGTTGSRHKIVRR